MGVQNDTKHHHEISSEINTPLCNPTDISKDLIKLIMHKVKKLEYLLSSLAINQNPTF